MEVRKLIQSAIDARQRSYCPYSGFAVGAALLTKEHKIYEGCNIENGAYSPSICAERTAFFKAISEGEMEFERIVIVGGKKGEDLRRTPPCGVCLQVMAEFCDPEEFEVVLAKSTEDFEVLRLKELLPYGFQL